MPVRRGFGTVRFSTLLTPPAAHAYHLPLEAFVRIRTIAKCKKMLTINLDKPPAAGYTEQKGDDGTK